MWVLDSKTQDFQHQYRITDKITQYIGNGGSIELFNSSAFDKIALINNEIFLEKYNFIQSELLAHIGATTHKDPKKALILGGFNIEIATELQKHGMSIDILVSDIEILNVMNGFFPNFKTITNDKNIKIKTTFFELNNRDYDLIIHLGNIKAQEFLSLSKLASKEYILIFKMPNFYLESDSCIKFLKNAYSASKVLMPFSFTQGVQNQYFAYSSNKFHPLSDLNLQVSGMLEGLDFYNAKIHEGVFYLSNDIKSFFKKYMKI